MITMQSKASSSFLYIICIICSYNIQHTASRCVAFSRCSSSSSYSLRELFIVVYKVIPGRLNPFLPLYSFQLKKNTNKDQRLFGWFSSLDTLFHPLFHFFFFFQTNWKFTERVKVRAQPVIYTRKGHLFKFFFSFLLCEQCCCNALYIPV